MSLMTLFIHAEVPKVERNVPLVIIENLFLWDYVKTERWCFCQNILVTNVWSIWQKVLPQWERLLEEILREAGGKRLTWDWVSAWNFYLRHGLKEPPGLPVFDSPSLVVCNSFHQYGWKQNMKTHWRGRPYHYVTLTVILSVEWASIWAHERGEERCGGGGGRVEGRREKERGREREITWTMMSETHFWDHLLPCADLHCPISGDAWLPSSASVLFKLFFLIPIQVSECSIHSTSG